MHGRLSKFSRTMTAKTLKIRIAYSNLRSTFPIRRRKPKYEKKTKKTKDYVISGVGEGILAAENENRHWKICQKSKHQEEDANIAYRQHKNRLLN